MINILLNRLINAYTTLPGHEDIFLSIILLLAYSLIAFTWGFKSNFLQFNFLKSPLLKLQIIITSFFAPALLEEILFRVFFLQPTKNLTQISLLLVIINLLLFVLYHPLNAMTFFPQGKETFTDSTFLGLAALLGLICLITYWQSGSLWLPVLIHWIIVLTWLICFGGYQSLYQKKT